MSSPPAVRARRRCRTCPRTAARAINQRTVSTIARRARASLTACPSPPRRAPGTAAPAPRATPGATPRSVTMPVTRRAGVTSKPGLCARAAGRRDAHARAVARRPLAPATVVTSSGDALLDRDAVGVARAVDRPVDRRGGRRDVERDAAVAGGQRLQVRADLVDHVAGGGRPVRADQHDVDLPALHQVPARVVDDHRVRDAVRAQLPRRQRGALVARPRLVDPDVNRDARVVRRVDTRQRRPPVDRRQPAGVAVGEHLDRLARRGGARPPRGSARARARRSRG